MVIVWPFGLKINDGFLKDNNDLHEGKIKTQY